jgi:glucan phosphoethanolaminetransferase (alkaline phosphatase superfamily)
MERVTFTKAVGFVLAAAFAIVIGVCMWALMVGDFMNTVMNQQTQHTVRIVGFAGMLAALIAWWCQRYTARRGFVVRTLFALSSWRSAVSAACSASSTFTPPIRASRIGRLGACIWPR